MNGALGCLSSERRRLTTERRPRGCGRAKRALDSKPQPRAFARGSVGAGGWFATLALLLVAVACVTPLADDPPPAVEQSHELGEVTVVLRLDRNPFTVAESALLSIEAVTPEGAETVFPALDGLPEDLQTSEPRLSDPKLTDDSRLTQIFEVEIEALLP